MGLMCRVDSNVCVGVMKMQVSRKLIRSVEVDHWNLMCVWNELRCDRKVLRESGPWVQMRNMSSMYRFHIIGSRL